MYKIVILDSIHKEYQEEKKVFSGLPCEMFIESSFDRQVIVRLCRDADGICVNMQTLDRSLIESLERCKVISRYGVGVDNIDLEAAKERDIIVCNCRAYCAEEVSDQALAHLLALTRQIISRGPGLREGKWGEHGRSCITSLYGKTIGIIGLGACGRAFLRKIKAFNPAAILVSDPSKSEELISNLGGEKANFARLIRHSDVISLHLPLTSRTHHLFSTREFAAMKQNVIILNTARGGLIDEKALIFALESGDIFGAGLDVFETEPLPKQSPLFALDNVSLSDHCAWYSPLAMMHLKMACAKNVRRVLDGKPPQNRVG